MQQNTERGVDEGEVSEFIGIINYCTMALIQQKRGVVEQPDLDLAQASDLYDQQPSTFRLSTKSYTSLSGWQD